MSHMLIRPLSVRQGGEQEGLPIPILKSHARMEHLPIHRRVRFYFQNPPSRSLMHGHNRLGHAMGVELPKRTLELFRMLQILLESRVVLPRRIMLVITPKKPWNAPKRLSSRSDGNTAGR